MKFSKYILAITALLALFAVAVPNVQAQATITTVLHPTDATNNTFIDATITNSSINTVINAGVGSVSVAISVSGKIHAGTGPSNVIVVLDESVDNVRWETGKHRFLAKPTSTTNTVVTNITLNGVPFLRLAAIENTNVVVLTNLIITASGKPGT